MSPRTARQFGKIREEKKNLIMDVALEHFASAGFHATSINHIARYAGISKGLMYNYFMSKEDLLAELIKRSVSEIYLYFDPDKDGFLTEDEFELFIRKVTRFLYDKRTICRLFFHMIMHNEIREKFMRKQSGNQDSADLKNIHDDDEFIKRIFSAISDYFERKKGNKPAGYDLELEMKMFIMTLKGFAVTFIFTDNSDEDLFNKSVNKIIELYK